MYVGFVDYGVVLWYVWVVVVVLVECFVDDYGFWYCGC